MDKLPHRERGQRGPFMLVITPTRELASQISDTCMPIGLSLIHIYSLFLLLLPAGNHALDGRNSTATNDQDSTCLLYTSRCV